MRREQEDRSDRLQLEGVVSEALPGTLFKVAVTGGTQVLCTLSGKMRMHKIRVLPGDRVQIEVSPYDLTRGRVVFRN